MVKKATGAKREENKKCKKEAMSGIQAQQRGERKQKVKWKGGALLAPCRRRSFPAEALKSQMC